MKPMTLRLLPVGFDFYLLRTGQRFKLTSVGPSPMGGFKYNVLQEGHTRGTTLHHSCQIKPVIRAQDRGARAAALQQAKVARQGHRYLWNDMHVIALETGARVKVLAFVPQEPWSEFTTFVNAADLQPLPMTYFGGQIPQ
jgi:hypothetical protein